MPFSKLLRRGLPSLLLLVASPAFATAGRSFGAGSLIIPMDNCYQRDLAQGTTPKELALRPNAYCSGMNGSNAVLANSARRTYGLLWHILKAGIPIYWIIDPNKDTSGVDAPDLTIDTGNCGSGTQPAVALVDQSLPASYCGLDELHPMTASTSVQGQVDSSLCTLGPTGTPVGTFPLGTLNGAPTSVSYRGGPFVIEAKNAALARDIMAWYFSLPPSAMVPTGSSPPPPATPIYQNPPVTQGLFRDTSPAVAAGFAGTIHNQFVNPGHHPLHWSQYAPSAMIPLYPPEAFSFDVGYHTIFAPCNDPCLCPYTTWDPINPLGHVSPWTVGSPQEDEITYATVNVHQAQVSFFANVAQSLDSPIPPIALAGVTDPVHINTFRFYIEESGLDFGPCHAPPVGWTSPAGSASWPAPAGSGDVLFDVNNYPLPSRGGTQAAPYSQIAATCAEGLNTDDPALIHVNDTVANPNPLLASQGGGPYGQVLDIIAPETIAFQNIVDQTTSPGCGAPRYQQLWVPHWDAYLCSGPTTAGCPLASAVVPGPPGTNCPNGEALTATNQCQYDPTLVQSVLDALQIFVSHGGNLLAECLGAASLEDKTFQTLLLQFGIDQSSTHFMTEWDPNGSLTGYAPSVTFNLQGSVYPQSPLQAPPLGANVCIQSSVAPKLAPQNPLLPSSPPSPPLPVGFPGSQVIGPPGANNTIALTGGRIQYNSMGGTSPNGDPDHAVLYAPTLTDLSLNTNVAHLSNPFLQIGDFYFQGIYGATESFSESANNGYNGGVRLPVSDGYAWTATNPDTQVLIRGVAATPSGASAQIDTTANATGVQGDYWLENNNSSNIGNGTVVYLQGDSFDGRPDGLRMVWSSIFNLSFVPSNVELARSSPVVYSSDGGTYHAPNSSYLLQGTFERANFDYAIYTPIFNSAQDLNRWIFPGERGHFRQYDLSDPNSCFLPANANTPLCKAAVSGSGSNTTNFVGLTGTTQYFWDSSEAVFGAGTPTSLLIGGQMNATIDISHRVIFTHLYQSNGAVGLEPVWLNPSSSRVGTGIGQLLCALFPNSCQSPSRACPSGSPSQCVLGSPQCQGCTVSAPDSGVEIAATTADVQALLQAVNDSNGGCTTLLRDNCYAVGTTPVQCIDQCWNQCLSSCAPPGTPNFPPFPASCSACGFNCANHCNGSAGACGVNSSLDVTSFRETCYPSLGGVDHSTPVVVGSPPATLPESLPGSTVSAACRPTVAYFGAGDGMLHAIYIEDPPARDPSGASCNFQCSGQYRAGQEIWAFMPNQNLPILHTNGDCSRSLFVDGVPVVRDIYANLSGNPSQAPTWHTILTETLGQGGNHVFALDITDPLAPVRPGGPSSSCSTPANDSTIQSLKMVLWEEGDPLDNQDPKPFYSSSNALSYTVPGASTAVYKDAIAEGPGFPTGSVATPGPVNYNHYLGKSATVFMGSLVGSGAQQDITYVAGQNGSDGQADAYGRSINLATCSGVGCHTKDFAISAAGHTYGPAGEVVYAFDSATGVVQGSINRITVPSPTNVASVDHFTLLYDTTTNGTRSLGNDDIPAPVLGVSTTGKPETDLLIIPDLDGQVWGLRPSTLTSTEIYNNLAFPLFDVQHYAGNGQYFDCQSSLGTLGSLTQQAAFANPAVFLPPGTCSGLGKGQADPAVILATGGVDWGAPASILVALDLATDNLVNYSSSHPAAVVNDSADEVLPVQALPPPGPGLCTGIEIPTCQVGVTPCQGRVFGQPLVEGQEVLFTTSTGELTGVGSSLEQQSGDGRISSLGSSSCSASAQANCGICQSTEQSVDLVSKVGKVASGLAASSPNSSGVSQIFSASTTGLNNLAVTVTQAAQALFKKLVMMQWWLRNQRPTCAAPGAGGCQWNRL